MNATPSDNQSGFFDLEDSVSWMRYMEEHGYCVIRSVATEEECHTAVEMLWTDMTRIYGAVKTDINTWGKIPTNGPGIISSYLPQSSGAWLIRGLDTVRSAFSTIWGTDRLIVSMDSLLIWLPWWYNSSWKPVSEGLHLDQNPFFKPDKCCVQGMVPLTDVTDVTGGLEVVPFSHLPDAKERFKQAHPQYNAIPSDWCVLRRPDRLGPDPVLIKAKAGDLILWDSRTVHGGKVGTGFPENFQQELARLAVTVCMTPRDFARERVLSMRREGFLKGKTFTHWPHEARWTSSGSDSYVPVELSSRVNELI